MWIRSQDKEALIDSHGVYIYYDTDKKIANIVDENIGELLGTYSTKEKAMKVLDMIQKALVDDYYGGIRVNMENTQLETYHKDIVFQMPQDDEVK